MDPFALTRSLIEIESITGREKAAGEFLLATLGKLAASTGGKVERMEISFERFNVLATWGQPIVTLSTTHGYRTAVFSAERGRRICSRARRLRCQGNRRGYDLCRGAVARRGNAGFCFAVCSRRRKGQPGRFVCGKKLSRVEICYQWRAYGKQLALGSKGALRYVLSTGGRLAHSAYSRAWRFRHRKIT